MSEVFSVHIRPTLAFYAWGGSHAICSRPLDEDEAFELFDTKFVQQAAVWSASLSANPDALDTLVAMQPDLLLPDSCLSVSSREAVSDICGSDLDSQQQDVLASFMTFVEGCRRTGAQSAKDAKHSAAALSAECSAAQPAKGVADEQHPAARVTHALQALVHMMKLLTLIHPFTAQEPGMLKNEPLSTILYLLHNHLDELFSDCDSEQVDLEHSLAHQHLTRALIQLTVLLMRMAAREADEALQELYDEVRSLLHSCLRYTAPLASIAAQEFCKQGT